MFRFNYVGALIERLMKNNDLPLQLELHPGSNCGPLQCTFCYGGSQTLCDGMLSIDDYSRLLDDLVEYPPFIEISGIKSDPLSFPELPSLIRLIKERGMNFGIHTKAYFLTDELIRELNETPSEGNYITLSVNSPVASIYNDLHGLESRSNVYEKLKERIIRLYTEKMEKHSGLKINIAYLLFANNSSSEHIDEFIKAFEKYADMIKFSIPQVPNVADPINYLNQEEIIKTFESLEKRGNGKIAILNFRKSEHDEKLQYCWAQRFNATIDKAGNVFPCPQVALNDYKHLSWGNIKEQSFWKIWGSDTRRRMQRMLVDDMKCRVCDRKDEAINIELNKIMDTDRCILNVKR
jgi:radical SAM protein with 4Fe4S-binding SPASM domain